MRYGEEGPNLYLGLARRKNYIEVRYHQPTKTNGYYIWLSGYLSSVILVTATAKVIEVDGLVERLLGTDVVPPAMNSETGVSTKDVVIAPETGVSARLFKPNSVNPEKRLPLLVYFHGGGFSLCSPYCSIYHNYLTSLVLEADIIAVSVAYRLAPENPVPAAYEDSWAALQWVVSHCNGQGSEPWLKDHADFQRVFLAGDSAGGNISHNLAVQAGVEGLGGVKLQGICVVHPYFGRKSEDDVALCVSNN
ncbi:unnamed protein product, partial [Vitis vinifera]